MSFKINRYASPSPATVNSYWLETNNTIVLIDTQRAISQAKEFLKKVEAVQKPVEAIFLTHAHPDHFGGLGVLSRRFPSASIYASREAHENLKNDEEGWIQKSREALGDDFDEPSLPTDFIKHNDEVQIDDVKFRVHDIKTGEAKQTLMFYLPEEKVLFCSDLVQYKVIPFLLEGNSAAWLKQLDEVEQNYQDVKTLYPGHGESGPFNELVSWQRDYIQNFRQLISEALGNESSLTDEKKQEIVKEMESRYSNLDTSAAIPNLLEMNVDAVVKELQSSNE